MFCGKFDDKKKKIEFSQKRQNKYWNDSEKKLVYHYYFSNLGSDGLIEACLFGKVPTNIVHSDKSENYFTRILAIFRCRQILQRSMALRDNGKRSNKTERALFFVFSFLIEHQTQSDLKVGKY